MHYPPSLPKEVLSRSFRARNGELGILPDDLDAFLAACRTDQVEILRWELWLVDHQTEPFDGEVLKALGRWTGLIPARSAAAPTGVFGGDRNSCASSAEITALTPFDRVEPRWHPYLRYNFLLR
jgi:hypothetical protein